MTNGSVHHPIPAEYPVGYYKWVLVGLLWLVSFCNYADRSALSGLLPRLRAEFHLTDPQLGLLTSSFLWVYAGSAVFLGRLADKYSKKKIILGGLVVWSSMCLLMPLATTFIGLLIFQSLTGLGEASYYPAGTALISEYHGSATRARALSIHQTAVFFGGALGTALAATLAETVSWRFTFFAYGSFGIVLALILSKAMRSRSLYSSAIAGPANADKPQAEAILRNGQYLCLCILFMAANFVTFALTTWLPTFLHRQNNLSMSRAALLGVGVLNMASLVGVLVGGVLGDFSISRHVAGRYYLVVVALVLAAFFVFPLGIFASTTIVVACLACTGLLKGIFDANIYATVHECVPISKRSTAVGLLATIGFIGAGAAPLYVGSWSQSRGLGFGLSSSAVAYVAAGIIAFLFKFRAGLRTSAKTI